MSRAEAECREEAHALSGELRALADELGVITRYRDGFGRERSASREAVLALLEALGASVRDEHEARTVRRERELHAIRAGLEPVIVAWSGSLDVVSSWCEARSAHGPWSARIALDDGRVVRCGGALEDASRLATSDDAHVKLSLPLGARLPLGYHRLELEWGQRTATTLVIAAPRKAPRGPRRAFGVFAPVYALRGRSALGIGTLTELEELVDVVGELGGELVGTLPLFAQYLDQPFDSSPFAPASRLFWNELLLDWTALPGLAECDEARAITESAAFRRELAALEASPYVRPRRQRYVTHAVLEPLARRFFVHDGEHDPAFRRFVDEHPYAREFAQFRAMVDAHGVPSSWPACSAGRPFVSTPSDVDREALHLYAQWQASTQLARVAARAKHDGVRLYFDLPLGVHRESFDMYREPACFVHGMSVGAPPDALCREGQDWGFAPAHPHGQRAQGYRYFRAVVREQMRHAGALRIDHVMGLSRVFSIPHGMPASEGLYLRQSHEELLAILTLEAALHGTLLVGEDLGTVPDGVRASMRSHGIKRMYVLPFELESRGLDGHGGTTARSAPAEALATLNTHDMPTFAGLFAAHDISERERLGGISSAEALEERAQRQALLVDLRAALGLAEQATREEALHAALRLLGRSEADLVQVALEDLWGEVEPQNVPGTFDPERNFCRRMRHRVDQIPRLSAARSLLRALAAARRVPIPSERTHEA